MKNIWNIFSSDMKKTGTNWVALIIIVGLIVLPSLYAWFNIKAFWDPYSQLDQLPIGTVNEDAGSTIRDQEMNVGDMIVDTLQSDNSMDWHFDNREEAKHNLKMGNYFAVIIIPEDFSGSLATVTDTDPEKAHVEYYVNEKINAIAPQITSQGASGIVDTVSSQFISTINSTVSDVFNQIGIQLQDDLPAIDQFQEYLFEMEERLPDIYNTLNGTLADAENAESIIQNAQELIPEVERITGEGIQTIDTTLELLLEAENRMDEIAPRIQEDLNKVQETTTSVNDFIQDINTFELDLTSGDQLAANIETEIADVYERIESIEATLAQLQKQVEAENTDQETEPNETEDSTEQNSGTENTPDAESSLDTNSISAQQLQSAREKLNDLKTSIGEIDGLASDITTNLEETNQEVNTVISDLQERSQTISENVDAFVVEYNENITPTVEQEINNAQSTLQDAKNIVGNIQRTLPEVENILSSTDAHLGEGKALLEDVLAEYPYVNTQIQELADQVRDIQSETDINEIIELLRNDPESEKNFFEEPVVLEENSVFPVANYGAGMTPFYTALAIWVGGLLLISLLTTEAANQERFTLRQEYFGKLLTFLILGILQTLIITSGDLFLLQVNVRHMGWFILFGLFISLIFMIIIYTLVSLLGDFGKAIVIIVLVLQIAGSGGTYPVVLLPEFFQVINPFLPFTYAIDLLREAVAGIVWERAARSIMILGIFGLVFLLLGTFLKRPINKYTRKLIEKSRKSNMFH